jgi:RNA polymerase sigma-70 factor (ECF subfamily)
MKWKPRLIPGGRGREAPAAAPAPQPGRPPDDAEPSDAELTHCVRAGLEPGADARRLTLAGHSAFRVLVERHGDRVLRLAWHLTGSSEDARDVAQDTFLRAYRSMASYRPELSFRNWLLRIAVNAAHDHRTRRAGLVLRPVEDLHATADPRRPGEEAEGSIFAEQVQRAAASLAQREREVFVLRDLEGLDVEEIAEVLGVAEPTVRRHLARARLHLRRLLSGHGDLRESDGDRDED